MILSHSIPWFLATAPAATSQPISDFVNTYYYYALIAFSSIVTGWISYTVAIKKNNRQDFNTLLEANSKFREEVKKELEQAKVTIDSLKSLIEAKDREMTDMQGSIAELSNQLAIRETSISELNLQIIKRDLRIQELENRMDSLVNNSAR